MNIFEWLIVRQYSKKQYIPLSHQMLKLYKKIKLAQANNAIEIYINK
jgi:hypothetical protein